MILLKYSKESNFTKKEVMRDNSNTFIYVVAGIILLHFLVGFIWLMIKLSKKKEDKED